MTSSKQNDYIGLLPSIDQHFVLIELDIASGYRFAFPADNASGKTTTHGLTEHLIHYHHILNTLLLSKELS